MLEEQWSGMVWPVSAEANPSPKTGVDRQLLEKVGKASVTLPEGFVRECPSFYRGLLLNVLPYTRKFTLGCSVT